MSACSRAVCSAVVALRKESVDRNRIIAKEYDWDALVALRKESVDRNCARLVAGSKHICKSLSARRAWIEIETMRPSWTRYAVALRKESVDRNCRSAAMSF